MAGETIITITGNLTRDPELRTVGSGSTVVNFTIASSTRTFNRNTNQWEDGDTLFMNCSAWDSARTSLASNIANTLSKGMSVIAQGRLTQRSYQAQDGSQRTVVELRVEDIGPSLRASPQAPASSATSRAATTTPPPATQTAEAIRAAPPTMAARAATALRSSRLRLPTRGARPRSRRARASAASARANSAATATRTISKAFGIARRTQHPQYHSITSFHL